MDKKLHEKTNRKLHNILHLPWSMKNKNKRNVLKTVLASKSKKLLVYDSVVELMTS